MHCSECGTRAAGKFCWSCGAKLNATTAAPVAAVARTPCVDEPVDLVFDDEPAPGPAVAPVPDWSQEVSYQKLLAVPAIRERIAAAGRRHRPGVSGEQLLAVADSLVSTGVSLEKLCVALQPIYGRLGIKTGKCEERSLAAPAGATLVATLCSLAAQGHELKHVEQADDGCALQAVIPSSVWSLAGDLVVSVQRRSRDTMIAASTAITGQVFDWGHSRRVLGRLFDGINQELHGLALKAMLRAG